MSGGSLHYIYTRVDDVADAITVYARKPLHRAFAAHLRKCSVALHDLEWVFSGDYSDGIEDAAIDAVLHPQDVLVQTLTEAKQATQSLQRSLEQIEGRLK